MPVAGDNIWPIGRGIPWGTQGYLPVVTRDREQGIDANMGAGCMHGLNNPFPASGADNVHRRFSLEPPSLLPEEAP